MASSSHQRSGKARIDEGWRRGSGKVKEPTVAQLKSFYRQSQWLTNVAFAPIHIVRLDERTGNLFILAGNEETIELQINPTGELL
jgi:hypothetical protein